MQNSIKTYIYPQCDLQVIQNYTRELTKTNVKTIDVSHGNAKHTSIIKKKKYNTERYVLSMEEVQLKMYAIMANGSIPMIRVDYRMMQSTMDGWKS